jgi:hypothetical protein
MNPSYTNLSFFDFALERGIDDSPTVSSVCHCYLMGCLDFLSRDKVTLDLSVRICAVLVTFVFTTRSEEDLQSFIQSLCDYTCYSRKANLRQSHISSIHTIRANYYAMRSRNDTKSKVAELICSALGHLSRTTINTIKTIPTIDLYNVEKRLRHAIRIRTPIAFPRDPRALASNGSRSAVDMIFNGYLLRSTMSLYFLCLISLAHSSVLVGNGLQMLWCPLLFSPGGFSCP